MKLLVFVFLLPLSVFSQTITWDGGGDGINWEDPDNWDFNTIPCPTCDVVIANAQVVFSSSYEVRSISMSGVSSTSLLIHKGSDLTLKNATSDGLTIEDNASCLVLGTLSIVNASSLGVELENGSIDVQDDGFFQIDNAGNNCLNIGSSGVFTLDALSSNPTLNIQTCVGAAINNNGSFTNNLGEVTTSNLNLIGISNQGAFQNNGIIELNSQSQTGLLNAGTAVFFNNVNGNINISGGIDGILNSATITNNGEINISNPSENGIESTFGVIISEGEITLNNAGDNGMILSGGEFENIGQLEINSPTLIGISTSSKVINRGEIEVQGTFEMGILNTDNTDSFTNDGTIRIYKPTSSGIHNSGETSIFKQETGSNIFIEDAVAYIRNSGQFENKGSMDLRKTPIGTNSGIGVVHQYTNASFINEGDITIEDTGGGIQAAFPSTTFESTQGSSITIRRVGTGIIAGSSFINDGALTIDHTQSYHIQLGSSAIFENQINGIIELDSLEGATALGLFQSTGTLINKGQLDINDKSNSSFYFLGATLHNYGTIGFNGEDFNTIESFRNFSTGIITGTNISIIGGTLNNNGQMLGFNKIVADNLINSGLIHIPYGQINGTPIHNLPSGTIQIDDTEPNTFSTIKGAIRVEDKLINEGLIEINSSPHNGIQFNDNDSLINSGNINISYVVGTGIQQKGTNGVIKNKAGGSIQISYADDYGIYTETDFINEGNLSVVNSQIGLSMPAFGAGEIINSGDIEFNNAAQQAFSGFDKLTNMPTGYILVEACGNISSVEELDNAGELEFVNTSHGIKANQILNSGSLNAVNVPSTILSNITAAPGHTFTNTVSGIIDFQNVTEGVHFVYSPSINYGLIKIDGATIGITSPIQNFGKIEVANCTTGLTGGAVNKDGGEIYLDNTSNNYIPMNEACGYIKSTTGYQIQTENYGFISHPDPVNANIRVSNYGVFENVKGMRQGQAGGGNLFNNDGLMTGKVNGKPSVLVKELNAMRAHASFTVSNSNLYTDASLSTLAGGFASIDNSISLNAVGALADTLYTSVNYGSGCNTVIRIPVRQNADCGGVYTTATSANAISTNFQWHEPLSWVDKVVPDGCTNVSIGTAIKIPANSKARAHSIEVLENFSTGSGAILVVDPLN
ncbi:beta strand repeat-containing protein [Arcticibacterium luteifluviistationis]|uniref:G8 domain-containing protein n=1 Tax=Arcticibacterium luteifluviistationis TaxID=1784714 RepID=A0A2Z4GGU0_9BACT|nr:hypothetical protein [Arcticibacterium luteifluviistationis]AWW00457.1 hypothetical protein DJ013_20660 [Arcticibacterium luteifluviistationis]